MCVLVDLRIRRTIRCTIRRNNYNEKLRENSSRPSMILAQIVYCSGAFSVLDDVSGTTMDWFKLKAGVKYSYGLEVFPDRYSKIGFLARPSDISPSGEEISEAIFTAAENIRI